MKLISMTSEEIKSKQWTEEEQNALRRIAECQATGDDSDIDFSDIPRSTEEQLSKMIRFRDRKKVSSL
jgi:hypothetical protein